MNGNDFNAVIDQQIERSTTMLRNKNAHYNPNADKLRAFKIAADLKGETARSALAGMMVKHTTSVYDMCVSDDIFPMEVWDEKITDHINYLLLLRAVVEEEQGGSVYSDDDNLALLRRKLQGEEVPADDLLQEMSHV